jgi:hypothetical protein
VLGLYRKFNYIFEKFKLIVIRCNLQNTGYMVFCYKDIRAPKSDSNEFENIMLKEQFEFVLGLYRKFKYILEKLKLIVIRCNLQNTGYMIFALRT